MSGVVGENLLCLLWGVGKQVVLTCFRQDRIARFVMNVKDLVLVACSFQVFKQSFASRRRC